MVAESGVSAMDALKAREMARRFVLHMVVAGDVNALGAPRARSLRRPSVLHMVVAIGVNYMVVPRVRWALRPSALHMVPTSPTIKRDLGLTFAHDAACQQCQLPTLCVALRMPFPSL